MTRDIRIPWRVAVVQRTLPRYRIPSYGAIIDAAAPGSIVLHGRVQSKRQPKQNAWLEPVPFARRALTCWSVALRIGEQLVYPVFLPGLGRALRDAAPDVIVTEGESNLLNNFAVARYARRAGVPYIWWGLGAIPGGRPSGLRRLFGGTLQRLIAGAGGVACYSSYARTFYIGQGADPACCQIVPNVLDHRITDAGIARFADQARAQRCAFGVADEDLVLLTVGSLEGPKRIHLALEAVRLLQAESDRRIHFWIVGDGPERSALEALSASLALADVRFWGARYDDVSLYFLMSDLFVLPGLGGLSINQAMMHALPVICGPADGTERDLVVDGRYGRLISEVTPRTLADAIADAAAGDLKAMGRAAQDHIRAGFSLAAQTGALARLIDAAMAGRGMSDNAAAR
ncbi:MAG: glycosyltransferase family 4 protein [Rhodospirillaceae bacterium]